MSKESLKKRPIVVPAPDIVVPALIVVPAKAGTQNFFKETWAPAFAGATANRRYRKKTKA
jgi:hypothetical protein